MQYSQIAQLLRWPTRALLLGGGLHGCILNLATLTSDGVGGQAPSTAISSGGAGGMPTSGGGKDMAGNGGNGGGGGAGGVGGSDAATITLEVQYADPNPAVDDNTIKPQFILKNTSTVNLMLNDLAIRYWYSVDGNGAGQVYNCDYAEVELGGGNQCVTLTGSFVATPGGSANADYYFEVGFDEPNIMLTPGQSTGALKVRFHKEDQTDFDESDDYSYDARKTSFMPHDKVTAYHQGTLAWGKEP